MFTKADHVFLSFVVFVPLRLRFLFVVVHGLCVCMLTRLMHASVSYIIRGDGRAKLHQEIREKTEGRD